MPSLAKGHPTFGIHGNVAVKIKFPLAAGFAKSGF